MTVYFVGDEPDVFFHIRHHVQQIFLVHFGQFLGVVAILLIGEVENLDSFLLLAEELVEHVLSNK